MTRRRGQVASFLDAFNSAYSTTRGVLQDRELRKVAEAAPEQSEGFTQDQGDQLRAAAESGQYDIAYDDAAKGYRVTPKADPTQSGVIAQQGVTDFLGQRSAGTMSEGQVSRSRQMAMAGVLKKFGNVREGLALEQGARQGERDDARFAREQQTWGREDRAFEREDELTRIETSVGDWTRKRLTNPDGSTREATDSDMLEAGQYHAAQLMQAGRVKEASALASKNQEMALRKIQAETAERDQELGLVAAAVASGDYAAAREFYDKRIPDGANIKDIREDPKTGKITIERTTIDGRPANPRVFKDRNEFLAALNMLKNPEALYNYSQNELRNMLAVNQDRRAASAEGRAAAADQRGRTEEKAKADAAVALFKEKNPNATKAELDAVRSGVLPAIGQNDKNAPAEVKLANAFVAAGLAPDLATGLKMATSTKGDSPEKLRASIYSDALKANFGDSAAAAKATDEAMRYLGVEVGGKPAGNKAAPPKTGDVVDGYEFLGGNPKDPKAWRQVKSGTVR